MFSEDDTPITLPKADKCNAEENSNSGSEHVLTHGELMNISMSTLNEVLKCDPLLNDLPKGVTLEEVNSQIALQHGQSMTVNVMRDDGEVMPVVVHQKNASVLDLKRAIHRYVTLKLTRQHCYMKISWRYVWQVNWLCHDGVKLKDNNALLSDYGICNKSSVKFVKRLREKGA